MPTFSPNLEHTLHRSVAEANKRSHEFATLEHLLLGLLDDQDAVAVLRACDVNIPQLRAELKAYLDQEQGNIAEDSTIDATPTAGFQRVIQRSILHVQSNGREEVNGSNVLVALFSERESHAVFYLQQHEVSRLDVVNYISHGLAKSGEHDEHDSIDGETEDELEGEDGNGKSALEKYCVNLNEKAREGKIDPLIGRVGEVDRTIQILCRRSKNNPLYVGDPGVGKTAIAEGLALRIVKKEVPEVLHDATIFNLEMGTILAGTRFRGDFEERIKAVIKEIEEMEGSILFIDEIHTIIGAGATGGGAMDASNLLKPALAKGALRCIGSTTYKEYRSYIEKDRALLRRFQKIDVVEPTPFEAIEILKGIKKYFEEHHGVKYSDEVIEAVVDLSVRHINERKLPDKAIDVIDEVGASQMLLTEAKRKKNITVADVENVVSKMARIPTKSVSKDDKTVLATLPKDLKRVVFGQDKAIEILADAIKLSRAGLREDDKPIGCYLFSGPTGVGKTEVAKQLASLLGVELERFDMSEYMERHTVSRLIGAPPGYVGYDQGGLLTDAVDQTPHCVLLLDEIEKAHQDVYNILLQVMDHGTLTDSNGKKIDFRNVILIMTTNAGAAELSKEVIGFGNSDHSGADEEAIKKLFSPEFRNRLDATVPFSELPPEVIEKVVEKFILELEMQLEDRGVHIKMTPAAKAFIAEKGYDKHFGARPLKRVIQEEIKKPLADELLFGRLVEGGEVKIGFKNKSLTIDIEPGKLLPKPKSKPKSKKSKETAK
ncbi:ATP-dependent Clp protease ATP-binding subunit ClpA [Emcibacteraceae bacterium]|mgnify:FL=1|nr:ATP-dependent Clp protease ATP-binding subunit ClpA [Emcibacteraceae bacterium]MDA9179773.1 ATP-dependent Clp protease ATP-binding subunit ClpA [Emcibacteraceae bacterium]MDA9770723.1 ATP-dependent Clp protease ATP-binding subunit ClpA [Emcibacteraceae bacterium]